MENQQTGAGTTDTLMQTLREALGDRPKLNMDQERALSEKAQRELQETLSATTPMDREVEEHSGYTIITFKRRPRLTP
jgi:hypothetical protein